MSEKKSKKRSFIEISSSSSSSEESEFLPESEPDSAGEPDSSTYCNDDDTEWNKSKCEENDEAHVNIHDEEFYCNKVMQCLQGESDLQELKLFECKSYLRRHGLRLSGTKEECIERIKEHWRLKDGNGETLYPKSSFTINCTGDVCKGDVVLFNQKVYETFDKMKKRGNVLGRRTVAGRIVKESYGAAKQQHTFTVEVLWTKGTKKLAPLFPLLVKGRNIYKMKTFRKPWKNEQERLNVLAEKHKRGAAARSVRAMRSTQRVTKMKKSSTSKGGKHCKNSHHLGSSRLHETTNLLAGNKNPDPPQNFLPFQAPNSLPTRDFQGQTSHLRHQNPNKSDQITHPPFSRYNYHSQNLHPFCPSIHQREHFPSHGGYAFTDRFPHVDHLPSVGFTPASQSREFSHDSCFIYNDYPNLSQVSESRKYDRSRNVHSQLYSSRWDTRRWR